MPFLDYNRALVRDVPRAYAPAYAPKGIRIDAAIAASEHAAYVGALEGAGVCVVRLAADERFYDCVFVEDTAIVWRDRALMTRMTAHREGEQAGVAALLRQSHEVTEVSREARLEGGDVLHVEDITYVGLTARTNERGAAQLAEFFTAFGRTVVPVPVTGALHLKTATTYLGNGTLLMAPGHVERRSFDVDDIIVCADGEAGSANCLRVRDTLIVRTGHPRTRRGLDAFAEKHSVKIAALDLSEFEKGDGSATCLSLLWRAA